MAADPPPVQPTTRQARSWVVMLVGAIFVLLSAIELWTALDATLHAVPATARVIRTEGGIGRTKSVHAQVEVAIPGRGAFRTEIEDSLGLGSWVEGGTVAVVCTEPRTGSPHCDLGSALDRWLLPVLFFAVGAGALWLSLRRRSA